MTTAPDTFDLFAGDALNVLPTLPGGLAHTCVTSPPYWAMRDYGHDEQLGMSSNVDEYVARLVMIMAEVRRVLREDGTLWINIGDTYAGGGFGGGGSFMAERRTRCWKGKERLGGQRPIPDGLQYKDLVGVPWPVAFALQADGWVLRSEIIWHKSNPMPESARKTFLILREHYFDALFEPNRYTNRARCTLYHEFAHWVLHRGEILELQDRIIKDPSSLTVLARAREDRPVPDGWTSPEWQAYAFAGAFLMPPSEFDPDQVSALELSLEFDVSLTFAEYHLGRCQRLL